MLIIYYHSLIIYHYSFIIHRLLIGGNVFYSNIASGIIKNSV